MQDILNVITSRRSVGNFSPQMVEKELINKVLKAGVSAPTGKNLQSPIILKITNKNVRDELSGLCASIRGIHSDPFYGAPVILVVLAKKDVFTHVYDGSCVLQNMLLEAHSLGLGACWIHHAKEMFETQKGMALLKNLGIKEEYEGIGTCILGYASGENQTKIKTKPNYVYDID